MACTIWYLCRKFWTRNRPGDRMRDRYNLNTLPGGSEHELAEFGKRTSDILHIYSVLFEQFFFLSDKWLSNLYKLLFTSSLYSFKTVKWYQGEQNLNRKSQFFQEIPYPIIIHSFTHISMHSLFFRSWCHSWPTDSRNGSNSLWTSFSQQRRRWTYTCTWKWTHVIVILNI